MSNKPSLSVLVISYNTRSLTLDCLRSVFRETKDTSFEIIVVDNASDDDSAGAIEEMFGHQITLIQSETNLGFAQANNIAANCAQADKLLLLNPDTVIVDQAIDKLAGFSQEYPEAGIWGGTTVFPDGRPNHSAAWMRPTPWSLFCRASGLARFRSSRVFNPEQPDAWGVNRPEVVDIVSGCFFLVNRTVWDALDGFDSTFYMYGEEADFCLRARHLGVMPRVTSNAVIIHYGGASEKRPLPKMIRLLHAKYRLCRRHWKCRCLAKPSLCQIPLFRLLFLFFASSMSQRPRNELKLWRSIWRERSRWLTEKGGFDAAKDLE